MKHFKLRKLAAAWGYAALPVVALACVSASAVDVGKLTEENMFPFVPSYDSPANVVNMSHLLDAPAGKHGRIRVKDGHFVNDLGRVRLHATNLTGPANFPTHAEAERLAARLARFGINCVRLHYFDSSYGTFMLERQMGIVDETGDTRRKLDPQQRDRQDYLIAQFKKHGIYVNMNLHVARTLGEADGVPPGTPWANKGVDQFDPHIISLEKEYARELLTHVNPYTGMNYLKDPVVAVVELNNEDALWRCYLNGEIDRVGPEHAKVFKELWNRWLAKKYGTVEQMREAWKMTPIPLGDEMVSEGKFDGELAVDGKRWKLDLGGTKTAVAAKDGALRVEIAKKGEKLFPKLYRRVDLQKGQTYTVSFRARKVKGEAGELGFAVADRGPDGKGWESLGVLAHFKPGSKWTKRSFVFVSPKTIKNAEIQFTRFGKGVWEIDDLSLRTGADYSDLLGGIDSFGNVPVVKGGGAAPRPMWADFAAFLCDTESAYWTGMQKFLQQELGLEAPVSGTQLGYSPASVQAKLDYVDDHAYWCHPSVNANWSISNRAMVDSHGGCVAMLAASRVAGKPYTVSEYNHPYPIFYGAEGQPMLRAYGALQGWDGVFEYSFNNRQNAEPINDEYFFSMSARTALLAHFPACAAMYLRGDVKESANELKVPLPRESEMKGLVERRLVRQGINYASGGKYPAAQALVQKVAVDLDGKAECTAEPLPEKTNQFISDTQQLKWNVGEAGTGTFIVDTANTKLFSGFPCGRTFDLGGVTLAVGETKLGWATVSFVSHDATGFGEKGAARVLITATGLSHNGGAKFTAVGGDRIASRGADWGKGKTMCEGVPATITLPTSAAKARCWALDERGERRREVPVKDVGGRAQIAIGPEYATVWYEVECRM